MKINIINDPRYIIELSECEYITIMNCLDYAWHRLEGHEDTGLHKVIRDKVAVNRVNFIRKLFKGVEEE